MKQNRAYLFAGILFMIEGSALFRTYSSPAIPRRALNLPNASLGKIMASAIDCYFRISKPDKAVSFCKQYRGEATEQLV